MSPRRSSTCSSRPGSASSEARNARSSDAVSRRRPAKPRASSPPRSPSSGATAATGSSDCARRAARSAAPSHVTDLWSERLGRGRGGVGQPSRVSQSLALGAQQLLVAGGEITRSLDQRLELGDVRCNAGGRGSKLVVHPACRLELPPGERRVPAYGELMLARHMRRGSRAGVRGEQAGAARTGRTSRPAARRARQRPPVPPLCPTRRPCCGRRRTHAVPRRAPARRRDEVLRCSRPPRPRGTRPADRARPPRTPPSPPGRCSPHLPWRRGAARSPARESSSPPRSRRSRR